VSISYAGSRSRSGCRRSVVLVVSDREQTIEEQTGRFGISPRTGVFQAASPALARGTIPSSHQIAGSSSANRHFSFRSRLLREELREVKSFIRASMLLMRIGELKWAP
jgi:hypothetical protein